MNKFEILLSIGYTMDKNGVLFNPKGVEVKGYVNTQRDYSVRVTSIRVDGKGVNIHFHRFQAYLKFGDEIFKSGIEVRHLNGNSLDNSFENISIGTHSDNMQDIPKEKRMLKSALANLKHNHKAIIDDRKKGMKYSEIMLKYGISSKGTVSHIINKSFVGNLN